MIHDGLRGVADFLVRVDAAVGARRLQLRAGRRQARPRRRPSRATCCSCASTPRPSPRSRDGRPSASTSISARDRPSRSASPTCSLLAADPRASSPARRRRRRRRHGPGAVPPLRVLRVRRRVRPQWRDARRPASTSPGSARPRSRGLEAAGVDHADRPRRTRRAGRRSASRTARHPAPPGRPAAPRRRGAPLRRSSGSTADDAPSATGCPHPMTPTCSSTTRATRSGPRRGPVLPVRRAHPRRRRRLDLRGRAGRTTRPSEAAQTTALIDWLAERHAAHPGMHVYHYNHTERSALQRLAAEHGADEDAARDDGRQRRVRRRPRRRQPRRADRRRVLRAEVRRSGRRLQRSHDIDRGAGAVVEYEAWTADRDAERLDAHRPLQRGRRPRHARRARLADRRTARRRRLAAVLEPEADERGRRATTWSPR